MGNPIKMADVGVPPFMETPICDRFEAARMRVSFRSPVHVALRWFLIDAFRYVARRTVAWCSKDKCMIWTRLNVSKLNPFHTRS